MTDYNNPADDAMQYYQQIPGTISPYYQPYIDAGRGAGDIMGQQYGQMSQDPTSYYDSIMKNYNYQESPGAQYSQQQLQKSMTGTAAAGGFSGTPYDQQQQAEGIQGILGRDEQQQQQQYFNNISGIHNTGLQGESGLFGTGYQASSQLAGDLGSNLAQQGGLQFQGSEFENKLHSNRQSSIMSAMAKAAPAIITAIAMM